MLQEAVAVVQAAIFKKIAPEKRQQVLQLPYGVHGFGVGLLDFHNVAAEAEVGIDPDHILAHQQERLSVRLHKGLFDLPEVKAEIIFGGIVLALAPEKADEVAAAHLAGAIHQNQRQDGGGLAADLPAYIHAVQQKLRLPHKCNT